jgi:hypothetical protein
LQRLVIVGFALAVTACGDHDSGPAAASQRAAAIEKVAVDASKLTPGANVTLKGDAQGCKDRAKAEELIAAGKLADPSKAIKIWSEGMQTQTCRGFTSGLAVAVEKVDGKLACILPGDDPANKQCFWVSAEAV